MRHPATTAHAGFTMIELLVVVAIAGILAAVGIPAMLDTIRSAQLRNATSQLYGAIILARSEAVKRNVEVDVQPGTACVYPASNNSAQWTAGWGVWTTVTTGGVTACDKQLEQSDATANMTITADNPGGIGYLPTGRLSNASARTFTLQSTKSATIPARCIAMNTSGQPSVRTGTAANGCS
ncbi:MAG: GspH/FimT family pseudopilin [Bacillota bacterium]